LPLTLFDLTFFALFAYWIFQILLGEETVRFFPYISIPAMLYILLAGLSAFLSQDKILSFSMLFLIIKAYLVFLYFANNIKTKEEVLWIVTALSLGVLLQSFIGILQYITGGTLGMDIFGEGERAFKTARVGRSLVSRVGGTIGAHNSLAMYLNFILPILLCFLFTKINIAFKLAISTVFLLGCLTELLTLSRGGWMGLGIGTIVAFYGIFKNKLKSGLKSMVLAIGSALLIAIITIGFSQSVQNRLFESDYGSALSRIPMMEVAFNIIKNNPYIGVGLNNYATVMNRYDRTRESISYRFPYPVHNALLIIASESGLPALLSFLLILFGGYKMALLFFKGKDIFLSLMGIGWFCGILTWIVHIQFKMDFAGINIVLWFSLGIIAALHQLLQSSLHADGA
jgi:hypothetical protein